jgi:hypothetical protein
LSGVIAAPTIVPGSPARTGVTGLKPAVSYTRV